MGKKSEHRRRLPCQVLAAVLVWVLWPGKTFGTSSLSVLVPARLGFESLETGEIADGIESLGLIGLGYQGGLGVTVPVGRNWEAAAEIGFFGFFVDVNLAQQQFGVEQQGTFKASAYGLHSTLGGSWQLNSHWGLPVAVFMDYGMQGKLASDLGIFQFNSKVTSLRRVGAQAGVAWKFFENWTLHGEGSYFLGKLGADTEQDANALLPVPKEIEFSGYQILMGVTTPIWSTPPHSPSSAPSKNSKQSNPSKQAPPFRHQPDNRARGKSGTTQRSHTGKPTPRAVE